jgi:hypothetical protein
MKKLNSILLYTMIVLLFLSSVGYADPVRQDTITKYYSISPTAFGPEYYNIMYQVTHDRIWSYTAGVTFFAPVYLPDSARVIEFKAWVDDEYSSNITVRLIRTFIDTSGSQPMATASSVAGAGLQELTDTEITYDIINNIDYAYNVEVDLEAPDSRHALYCMRIKYEIVQESPAVGEISEEIRSGAVSTIYPTPFSHYTSIKYHVPKQENVSIKIYDEAGRIVRTLINETMPEGSYTARWDGNDASGRKVASGSYFCVVKTNGTSSTKVVHIQ